MKALILASGTGKRLRPLTNTLPKPLLRVGDKTILDYQLESLIKYGITRLIITTGPFREKLEEHVLSGYHLEVQFVNNPRYDSTNYIYSLWLTRDLIDSDVLLLHGDLFFEDVLIEKLAGTSDNRVLVNKVIVPPEKDFKAEVENGMVSKIGVGLSGTNTYFCAPMYKFSKAGFLRWMNEIDKFIKRGQVSCYAEDAFNEISSELPLYPLYFEEFCLEIDTAADLEEAKRVCRQP